MWFIEFFCKIRVYNVLIYNLNLDVLINNKRERRYVRLSCCIIRVVYFLWILMIFLLRFLFLVCIKIEWYINRYLLDIYEIFYFFIILLLY